MNISAYILEYLKQFGTVTVPAFGVFSLESSKAIINSVNGSILPPSNQITFESDYSAESGELISFISNQKRITIESAENELQIQTDFWKKKLQADQVLEIQNLGTITIEEGKFLFKGNRLASDHPDFYGLEEIKISDINNIQKPVHAEKRDRDYQFGRSILWIFLLILPITGILYLAYTQQELLFGKKSFDNVSVQTKTRRIENDISPVRKDSIQLKVSDSLRKDSIQPAEKSINSKAAQNNTKTTWQR